jgi:SMI1-KNR4 cell-wall
MIDKLAMYEQDYGMKFPKAYKDFYTSCELNTPANLIGTDLINQYSELKKWAVELLQEHGLPNTLQSDDFVFMMHQGYTFWYFKADGKENPAVYGFSEVDMKIMEHGFLKKFLHEILG